MGNSHTQDVRWLLTPEESNAIDAYVEEWLMASDEAREAVGMELPIGSSLYFQIRFHLAMLRCRRPYFFWIGVTAAWSAVPLLLIRMILFPHP
jgi:hypothetical protein